MPPALWSWARRTASSSTPRTAACTASTVRPASRSGRRPTWANPWAAGAGRGPRGQRLDQRREGGILKVDARGRVQEPRLLPLAAAVRFRRRPRGRRPLHPRRGRCLFAVATEGRQGANLWSHVGDRGFAGWRAGAAPAVTGDGLLVVAGHDESLLGFSADDDPLWKTQMPGQTLGAHDDRPPRANLCGSGSVFPRPKVAGALVCLDGNSHKIRWERTAAGAVESTPAIGDDDVIYFGDNAG